MLFQGKVNGPQYLTQFRCIGAACEDTCCQGWDVIVDKATYEKYRALPPDDLKRRMDSDIMLNTEESSAAAYARMKPTESHACPFLSTERLCTIQQAHGEDYLADTCAVYPRARNLVDGVLEMSLFLSCPEAARLALLDPNPMRFACLDSPTPVRSGSVPVLDKTDTTFVDKPYRYATPIRDCIVSLLQNRAYPLDERLLMLGSLCEALHRMEPAQYEKAIPALIAACDHDSPTGAFYPYPADIPGDAGVQLQVIGLLIDHLVASGIRNTRFLECVSAFNQGLQRTENAAPDQVYRKYTEAYVQHYRPFMDRHGYILENYLVNSVFSTLFPFGPQRSVHLEQRPVFAEYVLLSLQYAMVRGLLIGMAGYYQEAFDSEHCVKLLQSYTKMSGHNLPFLRQAIQFVEACEMGNIHGTTILVRL